VSALANVLGVGASTPFGLDARQTAMFVRAAKLVPRRDPIFERPGIEAGTARALRLGDDVLAVDRMLAFAADAAEEALAQAEVALDTKLTVLVALPEAARVYGDEQAGKLRSASFLDELERRLGRPIDRTRSEALRLGHAGFAVVVERALAHLGQGPVLVGGCDSYHDPECLAQLADQKRLLCESIHGGFIPSEAAAFVVLGPPSSPRRALARVVGVASGLEAEKSTEEPRVAELMNELLAKVAPSIGVMPLPWVLPDVNGERHRAKEWTFATMRCRKFVDMDKTRQERLYEEAGELGAATGALYAAYATLGFSAGFAHASSALIALASDGDERGVLALEAAS
jgi:3-oxoacyl-[acyl-carrier-protein] synthase I